MKKLAAVAGALLTLGLLAACTTGDTTSDTGMPPADGDYNTGDTMEALIHDSVSVVCSLSGKDTITDRDIANFRIMADRLNEYTGYNQKEVRDTAAKMNVLADNYEWIVGQPVPTDIAAQFDTGCDSILTAYEKVYGEHDFSK